MRAIWLLLLAGCFSWAQSDPPPRERWDTPGQTCGAETHPATAATVIGLAALAGSIAIFATTEDADGAILGPDFEARMWGAFLIPIGIGYSLDGLIARSDAKACRAYHAHQRERAVIRPAPPE